ncbi:hypothetical protein [Aurantibacter sp.]|uniref:hypothetical protein n=1 Tax=Aurantibacter sp. TaxID=2807103 RepID=UPI0035C7FC8F
MEETNKSEVESKESSNLNLQDYLSLGYIFLLVLGVFHETIYYKFLDINILEYSSVLDVLISPVSVITGNLKLGLAVVFALFMTYFLKMFMPKYYAYLSRRKKYQSGKNKVKVDKASESLKTNGFMISMSVFMVFSVFIGMGFGRGMKEKRRLQNEDIKYTHELIFEDNQKEKIKMLGKNSLYVFYVNKTKGDILISPIDGNIKTIKKMKIK